jgi:hypothetical protein
MSLLIQRSSIRISTHPSASLVLGHGMYANTPLPPRRKLFLAAELLVSCRQLSLSKTPTKSHKYQDINSFPAATH